MPVVSDAPRPRDDNALFATDGSVAVHHARVIARRERQRATRQSIVSRRTRTGFCRFGYRFTVDRHGLRPRDDRLGYARATPGGTHAHPVQSSGKIG